MQLWLYVRFPPNLGFAGFHTAHTLITLLPILSSLCPSPHFTFFPSTSLSLPFALWHSFLKLVLFLSLSIPCYPPPFIFPSYPSSSLGSFYATPLPHPIINSPFPLLFCLFIFIFLILSLPIFTSWLSSPFCTLFYLSYSPLFDPIPLLLHSVFLIHHPILIPISITC